VLKGKGIWLKYSHDLTRALEMAIAIKATHLLIKVGHVPAYFPESARITLKRVRDQGYIPLAWVYVSSSWAYEAVYIADKALSLGYAGVVFWVTNLERFNGQLRRWADALQESQLDRRQLYLATPPLPHIIQPEGLKTLATLCEGGWMPFCFPQYGPAQQVIGRDVYQSLQDLSLIWNRTPAIYPVLTSLLAGENQTILPEAFIPWVESIAQRGEDFFSVYHAAGLERAFWPLLATIGQGQEESAPVPAVPEAGKAPVAQPVFIVVQPQDSVSALVARYGITREQFWEWNGYLWDERGMPRDPDYMQAGWRVRVR